MEAVVSLCSYLEKTALNCRQTHTIVPNKVPDEPPVITSIAARYLHHIEESDIISQLLIKILISNNVQALGTSWVQISLCCKLIRLGHLSGLPPVALCKGYSLALSIIDEYISTITPTSQADSCAVASIKWSSDTQVLLSMIGAMLSCKTFLTLRTAEIPVLAQLLLQTFIAQALDGQERSHSLSASKALFSKSVSYYHDRGLPLTRSKLLVGSVVLDIPPPLINISNIPGFTGKQLNMQHVVVAVFESTMELTLSGTTTDCNLAADITSSESSARCIRTTESQVLTKMASMFQRSNVQTVICQRRIDPLLARILASLGIATVERVSALHIGIILRLSGARQMGGLSASQVESDEYQIDCGSLGYLSCLAQKKVGQTVRIIATAGTQQEIKSFAMRSVVWSSDQKEKFSAAVCSRLVRRSTLLIRALSSQQCVEAEDVFKQIFHTLETLLESPLVIAGGKWQTFFASLLSAERIEKQLITAREACRSPDVSSPAYPFPLYPATSQSQPQLQSKEGIGQAVQIFSQALAACSFVSVEGEWEALAHVQHALQSACEAAMTVLEIDDAM